MILEMYFSFLLLRSNKTGKLLTTSFLYIFCRRRSVTPHASLSITKNKNKNGNLAASYIHSIYIIYYSFIIFGILYKVLRSPAE